MRIIARQEVGMDRMQLEGRSAMGSSLSPHKIPDADRLFDVTLVFYMGELAADASRIQRMIEGNNKSPQTLHKQLQSFIKVVDSRLQEQPARLSGEFMHRREVPPLAKIGAVTWGLSDLVRRTLDEPGKHEIVSKLNELSERASAIAIEYTPTRERDAIQRLFASFMTYFSEVLRLTSQTV